MNKIPILDDASIRTRLSRMAYEVFENHYGLKRLIVIGIDERGGYLATELSKHLRDVSDLDIHLVKSQLDRSGEPVGIDLEIEDLQELRGQALVVVDDVLYTGRTLMHVVSILLHAAPASIQTAVLIDRGHRQFPVAADIVGLPLATTLHQHVSVEMDSETHRMGAFLL